MRVFKCNSCTKIHVEAGNVLLNFSDEQKLINYLAELDKINADYYAALNSNKPFKKDLFLPVAGTNISIGFTIGEFNELRKAIRSYLQSLNNANSVFITANNIHICLN